MAPTTSHVRPTSVHLLTTSRSVGALSRQPSFPDGTGIVQASCRCRIVRGAAAPRVPPGATKQQRGPADLGPRRALGFARLRGSCSLAVVTAGRVDGYAHDSRRKPPGGVAGRRSRQPGCGRATPPNHALVTTRRRLLVPRLCVQRHELPVGWLRIESELGSTLLQACIVCWNAGACWLIMDGRVNAPSRSASGKFGTPCERIQSANVRA